MLTQLVRREGLVFCRNPSKASRALYRPRALEDTASLMEATLQKSEQRRVRHQAEQPEVRLCPQGGYCNGHAAEREARDSASARVNVGSDAITSHTRLGERVGRRRRRWRRHGRGRGELDPGVWRGRSAVPSSCRWLRSRCGETGRDLLKWDARGRALPRRGCDCAPRGVTFDLFSWMGAPRKWTPGRRAPGARAGEEERTQRLESAVLAAAQGRAEPSAPCSMSKRLNSKLTAARTPGLDLRVSS